MAKWLGAMMRRTGRHHGQRACFASLREHEPELKSVGVIHLRLSGSVARGTASPISDIDRIADLAPSGKTILVTVGRVHGLLAGTLGDRVDLSVAGWMRDAMREWAPAVDAF